MTADGAPSPAEPNSSLGHAPALGTPYGTVCLHCSAELQDCPLEDNCPGWSLTGPGSPCPRCTFGRTCPVHTIHWAATTPRTG
jgi:hypothetical protein